MKSEREWKVTSVTSDRGGMGRANWKEEKKEEEQCRGGGKKRITFLQTV